MEHKKQNYIRGTFTPRRTEANYMGVLLDAVPLNVWREIVSATVTAAKTGDATARAWLAQYLLGKPKTAAPAPLTVIVQQLSGRDPVVEELAQPHIARTKFPSLHRNDDFEDALKARVAEELRALGEQRYDSPESTENTDETEPSEDSSISGAG